MTTNREWLNSLSDEEFVDKVHGDVCDVCAFAELEDIKDEPCQRFCRTGHLAWLKQEHKEELKPCPFCGGKAQTVMPFAGWRVGCLTKGCHGSFIHSEVYKTKQDSLEAWNRRGNQPASMFRDIYNPHHIELMEAVIDSIDENHGVNLVQMDAAHRALTAYWTECGRS